jgi:hypothetical protein
MDACQSVNASTHRGDADGDTLSSRGHKRQVTEEAIRDGMVTSLVSDQELASLSGSAASISLQMRVPWVSFRKIVPHMKHRAATVIG